MNKPQIRFNGFEDEWVYLPFNTLCRYVASNLTASDAYPSGQFPLYDANKLIGFTNTHYINLPYITIIKDGAGVGRVRALPQNTYFIGTLGALVPNENSLLEFLLPLSNFQNFAIQNSGSTIPHIYFSQYGETIVSVPSLSEQRNIGVYFKQIDEIIAEAEQEISRLEKMKQASLQKMFPRAGASVPEIRFGGFTGDWMICKLDELLSQRIEHQTISVEEPLLAFSYAEGVIDPNDKKSNKRDFLMTDKFSKIFSRTEVDDIIYNPANVIHGAIHRNTLRTGVVSPIYKIFKCNDNVSPKYMGVRLRTSNFLSEIFKYIEGTVIKLRTLSPDSFLNMEIEIPKSLSEQELIGNYFCKLDQLISAKRQKLIKLRNIKQGCLDKMFVNTSDL